MMLIILSIFLSGIAIGGTAYTYIRIRKKQKQLDITIQNLININQSVRSSLDTIAQDTYSQKIVSENIWTRIHGK